MLTKQQKKEAKDAYTIMRYSNTAPAPLYLARVNSKLADIGNGADPLEVKRLMKQKSPDLVLWLSKQRRLLQWLPLRDCFNELYPGDYWTKKYSTFC